MLTSLLFLKQGLGQAFAQDLQGKFQDWSVFKTERGDRVVCYIASTPIVRATNIEKRGEPFVIVTKIENDASEISVSSGFYYNKKSDVELSFGPQKYYLFPYKALAWANDKTDDINIVKEMQSAEDFTVTGVSKEGKIVSDYYSLIGFVEAYNKLKKICN